jgi:dolichol-phosphate mannosyltransferase
MTTALALAGILYALMMRVFFSEISVPGWTLLMIMVLFLGGVQMLSLGVIGAYVGRIYTEVQNRPLYSVQRVVGRDHGRPDGGNAGS